MLGRVVLAARFATDSVRFDPVRKEVTGYKMDATAHRFFDKVDMTGQ